MKCPGGIGRVRGIVGLCAVIMVVAAMACAPSLELPSIPRAQIPQVVLDLTDGFVPEGKSLDDLGFVWRVYAPKDGRQLVACTFNAMGDEKQPTLFIGSFPIDESGNVAASDDHDILVEDFSERVRMQRGTNHGAATAKNGTRTTSLSAGGLCRDSRLVKIVGKTSSGESVETTPAEGFWYFFIDGLATKETWTKISGLDENGRVIVDLSPGPREGRI